MTISLGMFTNEGNIALAELLTDALDQMPSGLTADEQYERICSHIEADSDFCGKHSEWSDTAVREVIYSWIEAPEHIAAVEATATVEVGFSFTVTVPTLDGDARSVLEGSDDLRDILQEAVEDALSEIENRVGQTGAEWSGMELRFRRA